MATAFSAERTPTCTWTPKIRSWRAGHCICSTEPLVARVGRDLLVDPVGERMGAGAHECEAARLGVPGQLGDRCLEVRPGLRDGGAHVGVDLDRALHQLVLGLGGSLGPRAVAHGGEDLGGGTRELAAGAVDDLQLHLDPQAGTLRCVEINVHPATIPREPPSPMPGPIPGSSAPRCSRRRPPGGRPGQRPCAGARRRCRHAASGRPGR